jgi:hypothetical protein
MKKTEFIFTLKKSLRASSSVTSGIEPNTSLQPYFSAQDKLHILK